MKGMDRLGPWPEKAVATFRDLGLTEQEIARYFRVHPRVLRQVERNLKEEAQRGLPAKDSGQMKSGRSRLNWASSDDGKPTGRIWKPPRVGKPC